MPSTAPTLPSQQSIRPSTRSLVAIHRGRPANEPGRAERRVPPGFADISRVGGRIALVISLYLAYGIAIWKLDGRPTAAAGSDTAAATREGRAIWRRLGCPTCHSLYGLGGHLGPDLTNAARRGREEYVAVTVRAGRSGMPSFNLSERDLQALVGFLRSVAATGVYPPGSAEAPVFGAEP